jgi:hypothetical protein
MRGGGDGDVPKGFDGAALLGLVNRPSRPGPGICRTATVAGSGGGPEFDAIALARDQELDVFDTAGEP